LVVDDIADTGETFEYLMEHFAKNKAITEIVTCSVFVRRSSSFVPNYFHTDLVGKDWVVFPWEKTPSK
jgi:hypoxanthine phosphoribosyltransferase